MEPERGHHHQHDRADRRPVVGRLARPSQPVQRAGGRQSQRVDRHQEPRHHQHDHGHEQQVRQADDHAGIPQRQPDRSPRVGQPADVAGQALQRRRQPAGPHPRLDDRAIQRRDRPLLRRHRLHQALAPVQPATQQPGDPPQPAPHIPPRLQQPAIQRDPGTHQRGDLLVERQQLVQRDRTRPPHNPLPVRHRATIPLPLTNVADTMTPQMSESVKGDVGRGCVRVAWRRRGCVGPRRAR